MKNLLIFIFSLITLSAFSQSKATETLLKEIEGQYEIDELGYITYSKVIEIDSVSRDELYNRSQNYFVYRYGSGKAVIQTQDKEKGTIVGMGLYPKVLVAGSLVLFQYDTWHILRIDVKEGKARVVISLTEYGVTSSDTKGSDHSKEAITKSYPFNEKGTFKNQYAKAFYNSHLKVQETFAEVERALKTGVTGGKHEKEDW